MRWLRRGRACCGLRRLGAECRVCTASFIVSQAWERVLNRSPVDSLSRTASSQPFEACVMSGR